MSFWTDTLRPALKVVAAAVAAYYGQWNIAANLLQSGISDHQAARERKKAKARFNAAQRDRQQMIASATNPRQDVYGRQVVSGTVLFKHSAGAKKEFLYLAVELARHEIDAIEAIYIGDVEVTGWAANGDVTTPAFIKGSSGVSVAVGTGSNPIPIAPPPGSTVRLVSVHKRTFGRDGVDTDITSQCSLSGNTVIVAGAESNASVIVNWAWSSGRALVRVYPALGSADQTAFAAWQSEIGDKWTAAHRLRGRAAVGVRMEYDQDIFGSMRDVSIRARVRGKKLYDPRTGQTVYSNNSALVTADMLRVRMGASPAQVPDAEIAAEADICDQIVSTGTEMGSQRRYTCDIAIGTDVSPKDALDLVRETMDGSVIWAQGRWRVRVGIWREPAVTLTAADLADGARTLTPRAQRRQLCNSVVTTYTEPLANWVLMPAPEVRSGTYLDQDGGFELPMQISIEGATDCWRAQRLGKIELEKSRNGALFSARWSANAYDLVPGETCYVQIDRYFGSLAKAFVVVERKLDLQSLEIDLTLRETAAGIWEWAGGLGPDLTPNTSLPSPFAAVDMLTGVTLVSGNSTLLQLADGTVMARVRAAWTQHTSAFVTSGGRIELAWRRADGADDWVSVPPVAGDATGAMIGPLDDRVAVLVRLRAVNAAGRAGPWFIKSHVVAGKSAAPTAPTALAVAESSSGVRILAVTHVPDLDHAGYEARYSATLTAAWSAMTPLASWSGTAPTWEVTAPGAGTWRIAVIAVDTSGNESSPVYTTVTLGDVGADAGGNLVRDGYLYGQPTSWSCPVVPVSPAGSVPWTHALQLTGRDALEVGNDIRVRAGELLYVGADLTGWQSAYPINVGIMAKSPNGTILAFVSAITLPAGSGWQRLEGTLTVPANAVTATPWVQVDGPIGGTYPQSWASNISISRSMPAVQSAQAAANAIAAQSSATSALTQLQAISSDGVLSSIEKKTAIVDWNALWNAQSGIVSQANSLGITTERDAYTAALSALSTYLLSLSPSWADTTQSTTIVPVIWRTNWDSAYQARQTLLNRIAAVAATRADYSSVSNKPEAANLCWNGDGMAGTSGWDAGVLRHDWGTVTANNYWLANGLAGGRYAMTFMQRDSLFGDAFGVAAGEIYTVSAVGVHTGAVTGGYASSIGLVVYRADGAVLAWLAGVTLPGSQVHGKLTGQVTIPAGAATAKVWVQVDGLSNFSAPGNGCHWTDIDVRRTYGTSLLQQDAAPRLTSIYTLFTEATGSPGTISSCGSGWLEYYIDPGDQLKITATISGVQIKTTDSYINLFLDLYWIFDGQTPPISNQQSYYKSRVNITAPSASVYSQEDNIIMRLTAIAPLPVKTGYTRSRRVLLSAGLSAYGDTSDAYSIYVKGSVEFSIEVIKKWG